MAILGKKAQTFIILPDNAELDDTLRDLNDLEGGVVLGVLFEEWVDGGLEFVQGLLEFGFRDFRHADGMVDRAGSGLWERSGRWATMSSKRGARCSYIRCTGIVVLTPD